VRVYELSAQGADFERNGVSDDEARNDKVAEIRALDNASQRIRLITSGLSNDFTEPIAWPMEEATVACCSSRCFTEIRTGIV
jgi:hypothetical protein